MRHLLWFQCFGRFFIKALSSQVLSWDRHDSVVFKCLVVAGRSTPPHFKTLVEGIGVKQFFPLILYPLVPWSFGPLMTRAGALVVLLPSCSSRPLRSVWIILVSRFCGPFVGPLSTCIQVILAKPRAEVSKKTKKKPIGSGCATLI